VTKLLTSSTILLAFCFAGIGLSIIVSDAVYFQLTGDHYQFVIEFFGMMGTIFLGVSAKNGVDSVTSYKRDTIEYQRTGNLPAAPVKQS
jgi:hypothetical protein